MFSASDTIVAIATPPGRGGIGVVRISGPDAQNVARAVLRVSTDLVPRYATLATVRAAVSHTSAEDVRSIDEVLATYFPAPASYTGEDVVEISAHGSPPVLAQIVQKAIGAGARLAEPGEFTLRAHLHGRMDLVQAEAVADLIDAVTPRQARAAFDQLQGGLTRAIGSIHAELFDLVARLEASLDFPDEGYHFVEPVAVATEIRVLCGRLDALLAHARQGRLIREGAHVVILGKPNVGKSSLFNSLAGADRAIVDRTAGTTRDLVTELVAMDGVPVTLVDTAGLRASGDSVEQEGVRRATHSVAVADLVLIVFDASSPHDAEDDAVLAVIGNKPVVTALNKQDLLEGEGVPAPESRWDSAVQVSASTGFGIENLKLAIVEALNARERSDEASVTNVRHVELLGSCRNALLRAAESASLTLPEEIVLIDLQTARASLEEVTGVRTPEDVLTHIFTRFCIGK